MVARRSSILWQGVAFRWFAAFAFCGGAMWLLGVFNLSAVGVIVVSGGVGLLCAFVGWRLDARRAHLRWRGLDGGSVRVVGLWLSLVPLLLGMAGLLVLSVFFWRAGLSLAYQAALLWAVGVLLYRLWALHLLGRLQASTAALHAGDDRRAREGFLWLAERPFWAESCVDRARYCLGVIALKEGRHDDAGRWFSLVERRSSRAFACVGLAMVRLQQGRLSECEAAMNHARSVGRDAQLNEELDGLRLALVWRLQGEVAARTLRDRLLQPSPGLLFYALSRRLDGERTEHDVAKALKRRGWWLAELDAAR